MWKNERETGTKQFSASTNFYLYKFSITEQWG